jgi:hypothetical protein
MFNQFGILSMYFSIQIFYQFSVVTVNFQLQIVKAFLKNLHKSFCIEYIAVL